MNGEAGKQFAALEIVLRKTGEPKPRQKFVAFLHKMAALINFSEKQADGNVFGYVALDASKFAGGFVDPHKTPHFGENGSEAGCGLEGRVGIHLVFGKRAVAARLA